MPMYDDDDDFEDEGTTLAEVRKALRRAQRQNKELSEQLSGFQKAARKNAVAGALKERGLNEKIAAFVPADVEVDGIAAWLDEFGDVFAPVQSEPAGRTEPDPVAQEQQHFNEVASQGQAPTGDETQLLALIQGAQTPEDLNKIVFGNPYGPNAS